MTYASGLGAGDGFGEGRRAAVLITADLIGVPRSLSDDIAKRLGDAGVERAAFAISATHTHTGPSLTGVLPYIFNSPVTPPQQAAIDRYTNRLARCSRKWRARRSPIASPHSWRGRRAAQALQRTGAY